MITASDSISLYSRRRVDDVHRNWVPHPPPPPPLHLLHRFFSDKCSFQLYVWLSVVYLSGRRSSSVQQFGTYSQYDVDALRPIAEEPEIVDLRQLFNYVEVGTRDQASDIVTESDQFSCCMEGFRIKALD
ncbi:hypothetical protein RJT34_12120 [Clitoria ternatea]|uniref:Uncharacterized protein n=1 Tax=Clitoria ternatea TaxID=43366 RepID=A0AAN9JN76_CLITE